MTGPRLVLAAVVLAAAGWAAGALLLGRDTTPRPAAAETFAVPEADRSPAADTPRSGPAVRLALSAAFTTVKGMRAYEDFTDCLSRRLGQPVEIVTGLAYETINEMMRAGAIDCGFVCGLPYVMMQAETQNAPRLVAAPVMKAELYGGRPKYFSCVIVRSEHPAQSFADLRGLRFAYSEKLSNSGYNMPRARLIEMGQTQGFFGSTVRSGSHEESIRMVAEGEADTACVDSLVFDYAQAEGSPHVQRVRVIERLGPAGIPPLIASASLSESLLARIREILLRMHEDPQGRRILDAMRIARFVAVGDDNYEDVRRMWKAAQAAGFLEIR